MHWISIEEDLPDKTGFYYVCDDISEIFSIAHYIPTEDDDWEFEVMHLSDLPLDFNVTHWMKPELPWRE